MSWIPAEFCQLPDGKPGVKIDHYDLDASDRALLEAGHAIDVWIDCGGCYHEIVRFTHNENNQAFARIISGELARSMSRRTRGKIDHAS